ncbi:ABC transporter substrate-binding protein [Oscillospiraceae bacterium 50-58]
MKKTNTMKKLMTLTLSLAMTLSLAACGGGSKSNSGSGSQGGGSGAQQPVHEKTYKVGIVKFMDHASLDQIESSLQAELDVLGKELGVTFYYTDYSANGQGDGTILQQIGAQMIANDVDVIVPIATPAVQSMLAAVEDTDIPIIFSAVSDPIKDGIVADLNAPGGKATGTSDALNTEMVMELMLAANPDIQKVGLLYSKSESASAKPVEEAKAYLAAKGIAVEEKTGTNTNEISSAVDALVAAKVDAIFTPTDNTVQSAELAIFEKLQDAKIPHYGGADSFALNGAFCGYGVDYVQLGQATAKMVAELLVNGADPASTPVQIMTAENAVINTETCAAIGMDLDQLKSAFSTLGINIIETTTKQGF